MDLRDVLVWMNDNGAALSAMAAVTTALVATVALWHTTRDSRDRTRPVVLAEFRMAKHSTSTIDLVVRNAGESVARDVRVKFGPMPVVPDEGGPYLTKWLLQRYRGTIPTIAPGQELSNIWHRARQVDGEPDLVNIEPTADEVTVTISHRRSHFRRYVEVFPLNVDLVRMMTYSTSSWSIPGRIESIQKALESLSKAAEPIAKAANYIRREEIEQKRADVEAIGERFGEQEAERQQKLQRDAAADDTTD